MEFKFESILVDILTDVNLTQKQRDFLLYFFTPGDTLFNASASCREAKCSYSQAHEWRTSDKYPHFMKYYSKYIDIYIEAAEVGIWNHVVNGNFAAQKFTLERLASKKWKERIDVTSDDEKITSIHIKIDKREESEE